jgi:hypothetical protein
VTAGTATFDTADGLPVPIALVAVTEQVYDAPFDKDATTIGLDAADAEPGTPPFDDAHDAV